MEATRETVKSRRWSEPRQWAFCLVLALGIHAAGAAALLAPWNAAPVEVASAPTIIVELAPLPVAPDTKATEFPPGQPQQASELRPPEPIEKSDEQAAAAQDAATLPLPAALEPVEQVAAAPPTEAKRAVTPPPKPPDKTAEKPVETPADKAAEKPAKKRKRQAHPSLASALSTALEQAERPAAQMPGSSWDVHVLVRNWNSQLVAQLERYKRYPPEALSRGEEGVVQLAFSVDRGGGVHNARITHSSGSSTLDIATLALVERAAPLPPPPPEVEGTQVGIVVPIRYYIR